MSVEVNWMAILLSVVAAMVIGFVWYAKGVFGGVWMKLAKLDDAKMKKNMAGGMISAVLGSLLTAYILAHLAFLAHAFFKDSFLVDSLNTAFWVWLGVSATTLAIHNSFEQKPWGLTVLAMGNRLATFMAMGAVIGLLRP